MTTTTLINAVSVGATATEASNITLRTFSATSAAFCLQASLTAGTAMSDSKVTIHYAPVADSLSTDLSGVKKARPASFTFEASARIPMQEQLFTTDIEACRGRYLLIWVEEPLLAAPATLTVKVVEF